MKIKLNISLPDIVTILDGLNPRDVHPALDRAEKSVTTAAAALADARKELADSKRAMVATSARVSAGEAPARELDDAVRRRDTAALLSSSAEAELAKAIRRVEIETTRADAALTREVHRRGEILERTAAELSPILEELRSLSLSLARVIHPSAIGAFADWPCASRCDAARRGDMLSRIPNTNPPPSDRNSLTT